MSQSINSVNWPLRILLVSVAAVLAVVFAVAFWYVFAYVGMSLIIPLDYLGRPLSEASFSPAAAWGVIGVVGGAIVGLASGFKKVGRMGEASKVYGVCAVLSIFVVLGAFGLNRDLDQKLAREAAARAQPSPTFVRPNLLGKWAGTFGSKNQPATLTINSTSGNEFQGTLAAGSARVAVTGYTLSDSPQVMFREIKVLKGSWTLGTNSGSFSSDGQSMSGTGKDPKGSQYSWYFSKK